MTKAEPPRRRLCKIDGCTKIVKSQGLCQRHGAKTRLCKIDGCTKQAQGNFDGMCKSHFKESRVDLKETNTIIPKSARPPEPVGQSVYDTIIPASLTFQPNNGGNHQQLMPLVAHLKRGFDENRPRGWHRNDERRARGLWPVKRAAEQLQGWERELVWMEICILSGNGQASFRHLARAWGRDKGFHMVLTQFICERRGNVERKKRPRRFTNASRSSSGGSGSGCDDHSRDGSWNGSVVAANNGNCDDHGSTGEHAEFMNDILTFEDMDLPIAEMYYEFARNYSDVDSIQEQQDSVSHETQREEVPCDRQPQPMARHDAGQAAATNAAVAHTGVAYAYIPDNHPSQCIPMDSQHQVLNSLSAAAVRPQAVPGHEVQVPAPGPVPGHTIGTSMPGNHTTLSLRMEQQPQPQPQHDSALQTAAQPHNLVLHQPQAMPGSVAQVAPAPGDDAAVASYPANHHPVRCLTVEQQLHHGSAEQSTTQLHEMELQQPQGMPGNEVQVPVPAPGHVNVASMPENHPALSLPIEQQQEQQQQQQNDSVDSVIQSSTQQHQVVLQQSQAMAAHKEQKGGDSSDSVPGILVPSPPVEEQHQHHHDDETGFTDPLDEHLFMPVAQENPTEEPLAMKIVPEQDVVSSAVNAQEATVMQPTQV